MYIDLIGTSTLIMIYAFCTEVGEISDNLLTSIMARFCTIKTSIFVRQVF